MRMPTISAAKCRSTAILALHFGHITLLLAGTRRKRWSSDFIVTLPTPHQQDEPKGKTNISSGVHRGLQPAEDSKPRASSEMDATLVGSNA